MLAIPNLNRTPTHSEGIEAIIEGMRRRKEDAGVQKNGRAALGNFGWWKRNVRF